MKKYRFMYSCGKTKREKNKEVFEIYDFLPNFDNNINADEVSKKEAMDKVCNIFADNLQAGDCQIVVDSDKGEISVYDNWKDKRPFFYYFISIKGFENE